MQSGFTASEIVKQYELDTAFLQTVTDWSRGTDIVDLSKEGGDSIKLRERMVPCGSREAVVTVKSYENGIMTGCLQHPRLDGKEELQSLSQMVLLLNSLVDLENCPNPPPPLVHPEPDGREGEEVFRIQILFREHYTWQGKLNWQNRQREFVFHSTIELIQLLDEILAK